MAAPVAKSKSYWAATRAPRYSLVFVLPLFALYESLAAALGGSASAVRNAADIALKTPFLMLSGARGSLAFFATITAVCVYLVVRDVSRSKDRPRARTFALMLGESVLLALLLGIVVGTLTQRLLGAFTALSIQAGTGNPLDGMSAATRLMLALGAGLYEELLFRVLLVGGLASGLAWLTGSRGWMTGLVAAVVGALVFSAFHYVGEYGDTFTVASFTYRAIAGLAFSGLYLTRGFGITAWTHALYDVYVMVL
ncbi:MAG TPA: CPBP family intramembrane glutamic endopeptidase [Gemmatimonadaceae bacterium]|nr:CPBP family intramembrane glutamic endopeptidase [Gemmatimonadaceae bacterium]